MQVLQDNLQAMSALQGVPMAPTVAGGASIAVAQSLANVNVYHACRQCFEMTIKHVQMMRSESDVLRRFKMVFLNSQLIPPAAQEQMAHCEKRHKDNLEILGRYNVQLNKTIAEFHKSPLAGSKPVMASIDRQRQVLHAELEALHHTFTSFTNSPPTSLMLTTMSGVPGLMSAPSVSGPLNSIPLVPLRNGMAPAPFPPSGSSVGVVQHPPTVPGRPPTGPEAVRRPPGVVHRPPTAPRGPHQSLHDGQVSSTTNHLQK